MLPLCTIAVDSVTHAKESILYAGALPSAEAVRKLLYVANRNITRSWTKPMMNWATMLNQLAIRFQDRFPT
jgi:putative transposase